MLREVYSFAGNMHILRPAQLTKVADYDAAFGLAVPGEIRKQRVRKARLESCPYLPTYVQE